MLYRATPVSLDSFNFEEYRETATLHAEHVFVLLLFDGKDELYDIMGKVNRHFLQVPLALLFIGSFSVDAEQKHSYNVSERLFYKHKHNSDVWGLIPKQYITFEHLVGLLDYYIKETSLEVEKKINNLKNWDSQKSDSTYVSDVYEVSKLLRETGDYKRAGEYQRKLRDILSHTPSENKLDINLMLYAVGHDYFDPLGAILAFDGGYYSDDSKEFHKLQLELYFSYLLSWKNSDLKHHFPIIRSLVQPGDVVIECGVRNMIAVFAFLAGNPKKYIGVDLFEPSFKNYFLARRYALELNIDFEFIRGNDLEVQLPECDILMIDTLHTYDQLLKELKLLSGKTKRYILMHDTSPPWAFKDEPVYQKIRVLEKSFQEQIEPPAKQGLWNAIVDFLSDPEYSKSWYLYKRDTWSYGMTVLKRKGIKSP